MKKKWSIRYILKETIVTILMIFIISLVLNYLRMPDTSSKIPDLKVELINNRVINLKKLGEPLILHFWATWCPTCKLEAPNLESLKDEVRVITVAVNSGSNSEIESFMRTRGYSYGVVNDSSGELAKRFAVEVYPTTLIYNSRGELKFAEVGYSTTVGLRARLALIQ